MAPGIFITFEGSEGGGKTTQFDLLVRRLRETAGRPVATFREPGGTPLGEEIRRLLKMTAPGWTILPEAELLLFAASRAQLVREAVAPALARGEIVLCDRFLDSTTVYQGVARRLRTSDVAAINSFAAGGRLPDITFLLDLPVADALARVRARNLPLGEPLDGWIRNRRSSTRKCAAVTWRPPRRIPSASLSSTPLCPPRNPAAIWTHLTNRFHGLCSADCP